MHEVSTSRRGVMRALAVIPSIIATPVAASAATGLICSPVTSDTEWQRIISEYHAAVQAHLVHPCGTTLPGHPMHEAWEAEGSDLLDAMCRALDRVMEFPVTDNTMLLEKMEIAVREFGGDNFMDCLLKDARRLAAGRA